MREFGFELRLCARLEAEGGLVARQLGTGVHEPGGRVADVIRVEPGPAFEERAAITPEAIPLPAIEADVGPGRARPRREAFPDMRPERAKAIVERAVEIGFFERERRNGRPYVRQATRYPGDWFDRLVAIENKPDLGSPGALGAQLRTDVALGLADEVVLATGSYVTRAHLNRLPDPVGVWRFDGEETEVVREPEPLDPGAPGVEIIAEHPAETEIRTAGPAAKARARRRVAERAYGKGWRPEGLPGCANFDLASVEGVEGLPRCAHFGRLVNPSAECGADCPGFEAAAPPEVDLEAARDRTSPWVADPPGRARRQSGLDRFR